MAVGKICAQNPYEISLTGIQTDSLQKGIVALDDGGFITKEVIKIPNSNSYKILITRVGPCLGIEWAKMITSRNFFYKDPSNFPPTYLPSTSKIIKANDSGFLLVFTDYDSSEDCIAMKISNSGNPVWSRKIHTGNADISNNDFSNILSLTCSQVKGRGYAIAGLNNYSGAFMITLSENAKVEFTKYYYYGFKQLSRILTFSDSTFMLLFPGDESQTMKLDPSGNIVWARIDDDYNIKNRSDFDINDAIVDKNDFVYATGNYDDSSLNVYPALMKMDKSGNEIWEYAYTSPTYINNNCLTMALTKSNKIVLSNSGTFTDGAKTTFIETDTNGYIISAKTVPNIKLNAYDNTIQVSDLILDAIADSGFAFIGTDSAGGSLIAKADKYGNIGCKSVDIKIDTAFHASAFDSIRVVAFPGYWVSDTVISLIPGKNKATMICSNHFYPIADLGPDRVICNGSNDTLNAGSYNIGFKFHWSTGDTTFSIVIKKTGTYWVRVSNNFCSSTDTINVIDNAATAAFDFSPESPVRVNRPVQFQNNSINSSSYNWSFGTGDSSHKTSPVYSYQDTGSYKIALIAYGTGGCMNDTAYKYIEIVSENVSIYVPDAFSPDGNGVNDFFSIGGTGIESYECNIYNKWGEKIFHASTNQVSPAGIRDIADASWDGKFKGIPVPGGVYLYKVVLTDIAGHYHYLKGTITLMR